MQHGAKNNAVVVTSVDVALVVFVAALVTTLVVALIVVVAQEQLLQFTLENVCILKLKVGKTITNLKIKFCKVF